MKENAFPQKKASTWMSQEVRINGQYIGYNLLIYGVYWGYNPLILTIYELPGTSKYTTTHITFLCWKNWERCGDLLLSNGNQNKKRHQKQLQKNSNTTLLVGVGKEIV